MLLIETGLVLLALLLAFVYPQLGSRWFENVERRLSQLSRRRALSVVFVGLAALLLRAAVLPIEPIPEPIVHDEFGYLLAADTFAHGRLTNPTPPMWEHFETFSILMKPSYQCFAQPAQGMILALGKLLFGLLRLLACGLQSGLRLLQFLARLLGLFVDRFQVLLGLLEILADLLRIRPGG